MHLLSTSFGKKTLFLICCLLPGNITLFIGSGLYIFSFKSDFFLCLNYMKNVLVTFEQGATHGVLETICFVYSLNNGCRLYRSVKWKENLTE